MLSAKPSLAGLCLSAPQGVCCIGTEEQRLVLSDFWGHKLHVVTTSGDAIRTVGGRGTCAGFFRSPAGLASDGDCLWVVENGNHRIQKLRLPDFEPLLIAGKEGAALGRLKSPSDLVLSSCSTDSSATLYVSDEGNHRIVAYDSRTLDCLASFGSVGSGGGCLRYPRGLALGLDASTGLTRLYVADSCNDRISVYCPEQGSFVRHLCARDGHAEAKGAALEAACLHRPTALVLLPEGLLVCEAATARLVDPEDGSARCAALDLSSASSVQSACVATTASTALSLLGRPPDERRVYATDITGDGKVHVLGLPAHSGGSTQHGAASPPPLRFEQLAALPPSATHACPEAPLPPLPLPPSGEASPRPSMSSTSGLKGRPTAAEDVLLEIAPPAPAPAADAPFPTGAHPDLRLSACSRASSNASCPPSPPSSSRSTSARSHVPEAAPQWAGDATLDTNLLA